MATKNFETGTVIDAAWLNDVDEAVYVTIPSLAGGGNMGDITVDSVNKLTITQPAVGATLTVPNGTTATVSGTNTGDQDLSNLATKAANTFTGVQTAPAQHFSVVALGSVSGAVNIDLSLGSTFTATITGVTNFTFTNAPPAGKDQTVYLKLTNAGTNVSFPAGTQYDLGAALTLTTTGRDLLSIWRDSEQGVYVVGLSFKDYK